MQICTHSQQGQTLHWFCYVAESDSTDLLTAETYILDFVSKKWLSRDIAIPGHPLPQTSVSGSAASVSEPTFEVCQIKNGRLQISTTSVSAFAGASVLLKARLIVEAQKSDSEFSAPQLTIGASQDAATQEPSTSESQSQSPSPANKRARVGEPQPVESETVALCGIEIVRPSALEPSSHHMPLRVRVGSESSQLDI